MNATEIQKPLFEDKAVRSVNFFNGRLLTAEDLTQEQKAYREWLARLGRLAGEGVAWGLTVAAKSGAVPSVVVQPGLAVNRDGRALKLVDPIEVSLLPGAKSKSGAPAPTIPGTFGVCKPPEKGVYLAGEGMYLLIMRPTGGAEGLVETNGLGSSAAPCATKHLVEGVAFDLVPLDFKSSELSDRPKLRSLLGSRCFGVDWALASVADPFGQPSAQKVLLDELRPDLLRPCDVPLAALFWTATSGIVFVDHWSVRRRLSGVDGEPTIGDRRQAEAEAMFLQFLEHMRALCADKPEQVKAKDVLCYLPPAGILPLQGSQRKGFVLEKFFEGLTARSLEQGNPLYLEGAHVERVLRESLRYPALSLPSEEMIWVYHVRENEQAALAGGAAPVQRYVLFARGQIPWAGEARFDVARWDYANYG